MMPSVDSTALFTFTARFASINGVYTVKSITGFLDAVAVGVDFVNNLYVHVNLTQTDFNKDYGSYTSDLVAVLQSVTDSSVVYYVPESIFQTIPDTTVKQYYSLSFVAPLGVFENSTDIYPLLDSMTDLIKSQVGVTTPIRVITNPKNSQYLTQSQYANIVTERQANIVAMSPLSVQLLLEQQKNAYLAAKVAAYEVLIKG